MKRKLDENDEPATKPAIETSSVTPAEDAAESSLSFADLGLDSRLLQAVAKLNFLEPTQVQRQAIPLALEGKDILARAKTGSGKTAAYVLPILQSILKRKQVSSVAYTAALILVPTRELADQVQKVIESFTEFCAKDIQSVKLGDKISAAVQRSLLSNLPDIVVSTPAKAWANAESSALSLEKLTHLVLDEADLVLSYGYEGDLRNLSSAIPKSAQTTMTSATLTLEVDTLKTIFCRSPALLDLDEPEAEGEGVSQYVVQCGEDEKFLYAYVIFKLKLIKGKCLIFVTDVDRCYRLKLFFEQFGIRSCILNPELPVNSRIHVVEEFNKNVYDIIIASDDNEVLGGEDGSDNEAEGGEEQGGKRKGKKKNNGEPSDSPEKPQSKKKRRTNSDKEYGVSRGIDFQRVAAVINFDLPTSSQSYTHRIGRTARAGQTGMALSFVVPRDRYRKHVPTSVASAEHDERVFARVARHQAKRGRDVRPYAFDATAVDAFRYRMGDALRAVTRAAVREARTRELRHEIARSGRLQRYFEENPAELRHVRHDGELRAARTQAHLRDVPGYLLPETGKKAIAEGDGGFVPFRKQDGKQRKGRGGRKGGGKPFKVVKRKADPLKSFKARGKAR